MNKIIPLIENRLKQVSFNFLHCQRLIIYQTKSKRIFLKKRQPFNYQWVLTFKGLLRAFKLIFEIFKIQWIQCIFNFDVKNVLLVGNSTFRSAWELTQKIMNEKAVGFLCASYEHWYPDDILNEKNMWTKSKHNTFVEEDAVRRL